jgi:prepilin-type N-terminal cleavage/methylation domain-containing protein
MRNRRAFTLLELIVSIVVTGVIALLAYATASAGFDTRDALDRHRTTADAELRVRAMISDALRHASDDADSGFVAFGLVAGTDSRGLPTDRVTFLTRGALPPLGASGLWAMTIEPSATGLIVSASPARERANTQVVARVAEIHGLDVQVASLANHAWSAEWTSPAQLPGAVQLVFYNAAGGIVGSPLVVRVGLEDVR